MIGMRTGTLPIILFALAACGGHTTPPAAPAPTVEPPPATADGHPHFSQFSGRSIGGFVYLVTFGSVIGYTAFVWLLDNAPIGKVATYAYVNPVVAIALGAIVLHEPITWTIAAGAVLVLACVAIVVARESIPAEAEAVGAGAAETG